MQRLCHHCKNGLRRKLLFNRHLFSRLLMARGGAMARPADISADAEPEAQLDSSWLRPQHDESSSGPPVMADASALATAQLRYDGLMRVSKVLAGHRTISELFRVLAEHLHAVVPFDYLALILHEEATDEMRLVVLEPDDLVPPFVSKPVAAHGPAATVWETQTAAVIPIPAEGPLEPALAFIRSQGRKVTSWLPLTTAHRRVGVLSFGSRRATDYTDDVLAFMEQVAAMVAICVDNGINFENARTLPARASRRTGSPAAPARGQQPSRLTTRLLHAPRGDLRSAAARHPARPRESGALRSGFGQVAASIHL